MQFSDKWFMLIAFESLQITLVEVPTNVSDTTTYSSTRLNFMMVHNFHKEIKALICIEKEQSKYIGV